jgi:hypothetical protein
MLKKKNIEKQKTILGALFVVVFAVSFVLVVVERNKLNGQEIDGFGESALTRAVRGSSANRSNEEANYRASILEIIPQLNFSIDQLIGGNNFGVQKINKLYENLLKLNTPEPYQQLHIDLVGIALEAQKVSPDSDYIAEQRRLIYEQYPWLINSSHP